MLNDKIEHVTQVESNFMAINTIWDFVLLNDKSKDIFVKYEFCIYKR